MRNIVTSALVFTFLSLAVPAADFSGHWAGDAVDREGTAHRITCTWKQQGEALTGSCTQRPGDPGVMTVDRGRVDADSLRFDLALTHGLLHIVVHPDGESLKGTIQYPSDDGPVEVNILFKREVETKGQ